MLDLRPAEVDQAQVRCHDEAGDGQALALLLVLLADGRRDGDLEVDLDRRLAAERPRVVLDDFERELGQRLDLLDDLRTREPPGQLDSRPNEEEGGGTDLRPERGVPVEQALDPPRVARELGEGRDAVLGKDLAGEARVSFCFARR